MFSQQSTIGILIELSLKGFKQQEFIINLASHVSMCERSCLIIKCDEALRRNEQNFC